ncbi:hypothetical protein [Streptomyces sp. NPDC050988]|uniref:hypothetical protein n=1 Tax=Streptomyces sp. NPDC050988 TaxID=3365637 RepID=UPI0037B60122
MTREERLAHIRDVVDSAPLPPPEDIDRLRALLQLHARTSTAAAPERKRKRPVRAAKAA